MPDLLTLAVVALGVFLIAFMRGAFGGGFAIIGIPLLSLVIDPISAGAVLAPLFIAMDLFRTAVLEPQHLVQARRAAPGAGVASSASPAASC